MFLTRMGTVSLLSVNKKSESTQVVDPKSESFVLWLPAYACEGR